MASEWPLVTVADIAAKTPHALSTGPFGSAISSKFFVDEGVPVIRGSNLSADTGLRLIDDEKMVFITEEKAKEFDRSVVRPGDLIFTCWGTINQVGLIDETSLWSEYIISNKQMKLKVNEEIADPRFMYYLFSGPIKQSEIIANGIGAAVPGFNLGQLKQHSFRLPPLGIQSSISDYLDSLDKKIQLNRQTNKTLEAMAQALFKSWFVDFDPVIDNALAAGNPIPEPLQKRAEQRRALHASDHAPAPLPDEIRQLFPASFVFDAEMGWIPAGWKIVTFGTVSQCFDRHRVPLSKRQREEKQPGNIPYYGATSVNDYINEWIFEDIYLLIGEDGSVMKEDGSPFVQYIWDRAWVNNHAHVLQGANGISTEHLMLFMQFQNITAYVTGAVQMKINQKNMNSIPFLKSEDAVNHSFAEIVKPFYERYRTISEENQTLTKLRDTLLPKLISGELKLPAKQPSQPQQQPEAALA